MSVNNETIGRQAIGRHEFIGSLYDIRSDRFEGRNLFNRELPLSYISTTDCAYTTYIVDENESQKDTFNKLNIDASMKVSLLAGLLNVEGSAKYLNQTKTDSRTVRVTHILQLKTKKQHLHISMADLYNYSSTDALENPNATHCVIGITWGANVAATFEEILDTSEAAEEIQGQLSAYLKKPTMTVSGDAKLLNTNQGNSKFRSLKISFSGDVLIKDVPHTVEDVFNIFRKVPSELEKLNDGKGQQLEFELYPLKRMAEIFNHKLLIDRIIKDASIFILNRVEDIFEQMIQGQRMLNDFLDSIKPWKDWIPSNWIEVITVKQANLKIKQSDTQHGLATLLEQIRRGEAVEEKMAELLDNFGQNNPCSVRHKAFITTHPTGEMDKEAFLAEFQQLFPRTRWRLNSSDNFVSDITHKCREEANTSNQKPNIAGSKDKTFFHGGNLLTIEQQQKLNEFLGKNEAQWKLIYKAQQDGFADKDFHRQCDGKGPTMTVIKSKPDGYLFGGYTVCPWSSDNGRKTDSTAFLFTLTNPHGEEMTKFDIGQHFSDTHKKFSAYHYNHSGPIFGGVTLGLLSGGLALAFSSYGLYGAAANRLSADICVQNNCDLAKSTIDFPQAFNDTLGYGNATFTGAREFTCDDIELYQLN
ncbi:unnamed protein product [Adineta steineri]|uniref:TLDc domain-containing protein n=1 Tax=Adineta steineri TaxID=433720 RepID=A0A818XI80_9BILA|nr:unnamed protein product [Adineta steineri]